MLIKPFVYLTYAEVMTYFGACFSKGLPRVGDVSLTRYGSELFLNKVIKPGDCFRCACSLCRCEPIFTFGQHCPLYIDGTYYNILKDKELFKTTYSLLLIAGKIVVPPYINLKRFVEI